MKTIELDVQRGPKMGVRCESPGPGFHVIMYWKRKNPGKLFALVRDKKKYQNRSIWIHLQSFSPITDYLLFLALVSVPIRGNRFSLCCRVILVAGVVDRDIFQNQLHTTELVSPDAWIEQCRDFGGPVCGIEFLSAVCINRVI